MTMMLVITVIVFGVLAYLRMPISDLPTVPTPVIVCSASYPGGSPVVMADNIATPLEQQFMTIQKLKLVTSQSLQGQTTITLQFDLSKTLDSAATDVQSAIQQALSNLPSDIPQQPTYSKNNPNDKPLIYLGLISNTMTTGDLHDYASNIVAQQISIMSGVSQAQVFGVMSAVRVEVDPSKLAIRGITWDELVSYVQGGTTFQGAGQFDGDAMTFLLDPQGQLETSEDYANLILTWKNNRPIYLKDVATVEEALQSTRYSFSFWLRDHVPPSAAVIVAVNLASGANAVEVATAIRNRLPAFREQLPGSIDLLVVYDRSESIIASVNDVQETLVIAFILVVAVIFIFLGRASDTIIPTIALPLSLLLTFLPMYALGYSFDNLSLMALTLAIGFLVDDAIVFLENAVRRMEGGEAAMVASINGAKEISFTILSMTLSLAAVFIPLVTMPGYIGRMFFELGAVIIISVLASGLVSMSVTPLMCSRMLGSRVAGHQTWMERTVALFLKPVIRLYGSTLHVWMRVKWLSIVAWGGAMALTVYFYQIIPKTFLPVGDSGFAMGIFMAPQDVSPDQMAAFQKQADEAMHANPHVVQTFNVSGIASVTPSNQALIGYILGPFPRPSIQEIAMDVNGRLAEIPGIQPFTRPVPTLEVSTGATSTNQGQYAYSLSGTEPDKIYAAAEAMLEAMRKIPGILNPSSDMQLKASFLRIKILRDRAIMYGVTAEAIENTLSNAYAQNYVYLIKKPADQYQVIIEAKAGSRAEPSNLRQLYVTSSNSAPVPMSAVAEWEEVTGPLAINHINQFTSATVFFDLEPGAPIGTITDAINKAAADLVPPSVTGTLQGEANLFVEMVDGLSMGLVLAVFVMYIILGILYESYLHPLTVLSALPVAMVGGFAALVVWNEPLSLYAFIGLFMLMGIVKKNGIMMVDFALQRMDEGLSRYDAVHEACLERFRPILMTTLAALMGAVPMAMGYGADGASRQSLGLIIVGGLLVSQVVTLYITPVIFLYFETFQEKVLDRVPFFRSIHSEKSRLEAAR
jgi:HAE1 family hydrophobic/amphiphilic exporter-1